MTHEERLIGYFKSNGEGTAAMITKVVKLPRKTVQNTLHVMKTKGLASNSKDGIWTLKEIPSGLPTLEKQKKRGKRAKSIPADKVKQSLERFKSLAAIVQIGHKSVRAINWLPCCQQSKVTDSISKKASSQQISSLRRRKISSNRSMRCRNSWVRVSGTWRSRS